MLIARQFLQSLIVKYDKYDKHIMYTDSGTWNPEACKVLIWNTMTTSMGKEFDLKRVIHFLWTWPILCYYPCCKYKYCNIVL